MIFGDVARSNYEIVARLKDPKNPTVNKSLRTATLLTCIVLARMLYLCTKALNL